jgi:hypothetical protein
MIDDFPLHNDADEEDYQIPIKVHEFVELKNLDLQEELAHQLVDAKNLYEQVRNSTSTPANQKAQVLGVLQTIISNIKKTQEDLHNIERLKSMEEALITTLKNLDPAIQDKFLAEYKVRLEQS